MLNPRLEKQSGVWWLVWDADTQALAYDILLPDTGKHVQAGKLATRSKLGSSKPVKMPLITAAHGGVYETAADPDAPPPPPPPAGIPQFGISTGANPTNAVLDECVPLGADYVRFDYGHDATGIARVNRVHANGQHALLILPKRSPAGLGSTIGAYWKDKLPLRWYEIMNEPDLNNWTAVAYAAAAKQWCAELKAADPDCLIALPGQFKGRDAATSATAYCREVCKADCDFDVWSVHYADDDTWNSPGSGWHIMYPHGDRAAGDTIREILDANGRAHVPIMSSESHAFYRDGLAGQAAKVKRFLNYTVAPPDPQCKPLASVAIYRVDHYETGTLDSSLLNPDGSERPAYAAFRDYVGGR